MMQYATPAELAHHLDPDNLAPEIPTLATVLLRRASELVRDATAGAQYPVDSDGYPTVPSTIAAFRDATCEQAASWSLHGIDPRKGRAGAKLVVTTKALLGGSIGYGQSAGVQDAIEDLSAGDTLAESAWQILRRAGLISNRVSAASTSAWIGDPDPRPYDPTTGRFIS